MTLDKLRKILFGIVVAVIVIVAGLSLLDITTKARHLITSRLMKI